MDYLETFAPIANMNIVRILLSLVANYNWDLQQFDVKNAFLNGDLEEEFIWKSLLDLVVNQPLKRCVN